MRFSDMTGEFRMEARRIVDDAGGMVAGYYGSALQVALPADDLDCREMTAGLESLGLVGEPTFTWFPLGSDNPPASMRHYGIGTRDCPRGDRPSYWKYRNFHVAEETEGGSIWDDEPADNRADSAVSLGPNPILH